MEQTIFPPTTKRVPMHTNPKVNETISKKTKSNISQYQHKSEEEIHRRLNQLDREWDTERTLETSAASLVLGSTILGVTLNKRWHLLSGVVGFFLLQHVLQGWCPPLPLIRKLGVRTASEINEEKNGLEKLLIEKQQ